MIPQDMTPAYEPIGTITALSSGFVVSIRGKTVACRNAKELGQAVEKACRKIKLPERNPMGNAPMSPSWSSNPEFSIPTPLTPSSAPSAAPQSVDNSPMREGARLQTELVNLTALCKARAQGLLSQQAFYTRIAEFCPDVADEAVQQMLAQYENEEMSRQESGRPVPCMCLGGEICHQVVSIPNTGNLCRACQSGDHLHPMPGRDPMEVPMSSVRIIAPDGLDSEMTGYQTVEQAEIEDGAEQESGFGDPDPAPAG